MAKKRWTEPELRAEFLMRLRGRHLQPIADEIGVTTQFLSQIKGGERISDKVLSWMGYQRAEQMFVRKPKEVK